MEKNIIFLLNILHILKKSSDIKGVQMLFKQFCSEGRSDGSTAMTQVADVRYQNALFSNHKL